MDDQSRREVEGQGIFALIIVALFFGINHNGDYWFNHWLGKWATLLGALTLVISYSLGKFLHASIGALFAVTMLSCIKSFGWTFIARDSAYTAFSLMVFVTFFICFDDARAALFQKILAAISGLSVIHTLSQFNLDPFVRGAFSGNASMNGCLIAVTFPFLFQIFERRRGPRILAVLATLLAIFMTNASIPLGAFGVAAFAFVSVKYRSLKPLLGLAAIGAAMSSAAFIIQGPTLFNSTGRFFYWAKILDWWAQSKTWFFGMGMGSIDMVYQALFQSIARNPDDALLRWAHNDYIDILFEMGLVGLGAAVVATYFVLKKAANRPHLFAACAAYVFTMFFNYPTHLPFHAFTGACLVWLTFRGVQN